MPPRLIAPPPSVTPGANTKGRWSALQRRSSIRRPCGNPPNAPIRRAPNQAGGEFPAAFKRRSEGTGALLSVPTGFAAAVGCSVHPQRRRRPSRRSPCWAVCMIGEGGEWRGPGHGEKCARARDGSRSGAPGPSTSGPAGVGRIDAARLALRGRIRRNKSARMELALLTNVCMRPAIAGGGSRGTRNMSKARSTKRRARSRRRATR